MKRFSNNVFNVFPSSLALTLAMLGALGCSGDDTSAAATDAGTHGDASSGDAGGSADSGGAVDSGLDSGSVTDTGAGDTGVVDTGIDAAIDAGPQPVNGCDSTAFAASDHTAAADPRAITFPLGGAPAQYSIPCMHIKVGQSVTWSGAFTNHPLEPMGGDANSPIVLTGTGASVTFAFAAAGVYGFDCANHPGVMHGAIRVTQ
jgi:plastocyanin